MTEKERNDFFYLCSLIEFTARKTKNRRGAVVSALGEKGVEKELHDAEVNHCLSFEQVSDELIERYGIKMEILTRLRAVHLQYLDLWTLEAFTAF